MKPDFFILGAPKCGTTSLAEWLKGSPHAFVSTPKEPNFFAPDVVPSVYRTEEQYERLFDDATSKHGAIGEASTVYLQSAVAVPRILAYRPDARFIVMLRSPIEMAVSLHGQMLYSLNEDIASFEEAWDAQESRARGERIPDRCRSPVFLQYGEACRLGSHVERLFRTVDRDRVEIVFLEDMRRDAEGTYRRIAAFLEIDPEPLPAFEAANVRKTHRVRWLKSALRAYKDFKERTGLRFQTGLLAGLHTWNQKPVPRPSVEPDVRRRLVDYFRDDIALLGQLTERDLGHWVN